MKVKPKKFLGQHFLKDQNIARKIVDAITFKGGYSHLLEIGPGMGILTQYLVQKTDINTFFVDIDQESIDYLKKEFPEHRNYILQGDFLELDPDELFHGNFGLVGNFPYNISSQIFFRVLDMRDRIPEVVGMVQKEVAERLSSPSHNKTYGKLTVMLKAFYDIEYLFTVEPSVFHPPPKVRSAVIRLNRNNTIALPCNETYFFKLVKQGFQNRRKTLRNALKGLNLPEGILNLPLLQKRAEQLEVDDFVDLCLKIEDTWSH